MNLPQSITRTQNADVLRCIEACRDCHRSCTEMIAHCLQLGGDHAEVGHITLMRDCTDLCELSEEAMLRSSRFVNRICVLCADVCDACADSCDQFDDEVMKQGAAQCRICADACREMPTGGEIRNRLTSFS
jgi:hypothetical protein